jgi:hypothetical protein
VAVAEAFLEIELARFERVVIVFLVALRIRMTIDSVALQKTEPKRPSGIGGRQRLIRPRLGLDPAHDEPL